MKINLLKKDFANHHRKRWVRLLNKEFVKTEKVKHVFFLSLFATKIIFGKMF